MRVSHTVLLQKHLNTRVQKQKHKQEDMFTEYSYRLEIVKILRLTSVSESTITERLNELEVHSPVKILQKVMGGGKVGNSNNL